MGVGRRRPVPVLAILMGRRLGPPWGLAAAALFLASPMALVFSMTTHAQLASRALIALMLLAFWSPIVKGDCADGRSPGDCSVLRFCAVR